MAGMFDDLIPRGAARQPAAGKPGMFDDLVPAPKKAKGSLAGALIGSNDRLAGGTATFDSAVPLMGEYKAATIAGMNALTGHGSFGENWTAERARQQQVQQGFTAEHPIGANALRTYGAATTMLAPGGAALKGGSFAGNALRGAVIAGGSGAGYAAATTPGTAEERLKAAADASHNPLTLALGAVGGAAATKAEPKVIPGKPPTQAELTTQRKAAYKAVEKSGHQYDAGSFAGMVNDIKASLAKEDFDPDFHKPVQLMLDKLDAKVKAGAAPTLAQMDALRKFVNKNVKGDGNIKRLGGVISRGIDDFIDAQGGDAAALVGKARDLFKRESKVAEVNKAVDKSARQAKRSGSGGNYDNATRIKMDGILEKNPYLTGDEKAALENIVMGDKGQNAMRAYGKTSPLSGGLSAQINTGFGIMTGGVSGLLHSAPSSVAKLAADNITRTKVNRLLDLMASGGTKEQLIAIRNQARTVPGPAGSALQKMAAARLARAAGVGGVALSAPASASAQPAPRAASPGR